MKKDYQLSALFVRAVAVFCFFSFSQTVLKTVLSDFIHRVSKRAIFKKFFIIELAKVVRQIRAFTTVSDSEINCANINYSIPNPLIKIHGKLDRLGFINLIINGNMCVKGAVSSVTLIASGAT